jgi:hypothetical protein
MTFLLIALAIGAGAVSPGFAQQAQPAAAPAAPQITPAGEEMRVNADDIDTLLADGKVVFLDVREPKELEELGTRPGYLNIPLGQLERRLNELPKDKAILTA